MRPRLVILAFAALLALSLPALAGCGGGGGEGGSGTDPAEVAPAGTAVFIEATVRPEGELREDVDALAGAIAGVDSLGGKIAAELEAAAGDSGKQLDFARDVEPWLGERAGLALERYDGEEFRGYVAAVQTSDEGASEAFLDKFLGAPGEQPRRASYEGVEYRIDPDDGGAVGVFDGLLVFAEDEGGFKRAVDASGGDSLGDSDAYADAVGAAPSGSLADAFVDLGALVRQSGDRIDAETNLFLESAGIEPENATALASLVPGADRVEIELSTDVTENAPTSGDASELLGSLPTGTFAAVASDEFGKRFRAAIDELDERGIPDAIPPKQLKRGLKQAGIDLDAIASGAGDLAVFAEGNSRRTLGIGVVIATENGQQAKNTISNVGMLLRGAGVDGVTAVDSGFSGFTVRGAGIDGGPLVVGAGGERIAVATSVKAASAALSGGAGTLAENPTFKRAVAALGETPISGYADGQAALRLASQLLPAGDGGFRQARPFLEKISFLALGGGESGDRSTAKLIAGVAG